MVEKYFKKKVVVEVMQFTEETKNSVFNWITCSTYPDFDENNNPILKIQTLEGVMVVSLDNYVVKGPFGEYWPVKKEIFEATYEKVT